MKNEHGLIKWYVWLMLLAMTVSGVAFWRGDTNAMIFFGMSAIIVLLGAILAKIK